MEGLTTMRLIIPRTGFAIAPLVRPFAWGQAPVGAGFSHPPQGIGHWWHGHAAACPWECRSSRGVEGHQDKGL